MPSVLVATLAWAATGAKTDCLRGQFLRQRKEGGVGAEERLGSWGGIKARLYRGPSTVRSLKSQRPTVS